MTELITQLKQGLENTALIDNAIAALQTNLAPSEPFFAHCLRTGLLLKETGADQMTISAGIVHELSLDKITNPEIKQILQKTNQLRELCQPSKGLKKLRMPAILPLDLFFYRFFL